MKDFEVDVFFTGRKTYAIEANNEEKAIQIAKESFMSERRDDLKGAIVKGYTDVRVGKPYEG